MKGIILAGGKGTRLYPATRVVSKQLLPVHDKPMIYYPMSVLMLAGIRDILIISTRKFLPSYKELFHDGSHIGLKISYAPQDNPRGIADAFIIGEDFIGQDSVSLILGDNIFFGHGLTDKLENTRRNTENRGGASLFCYYVDNPQSYGVVELAGNGSVVSIEEKPEDPRSHYAVTGLYFYDNDVVGFAKDVEPSNRGEIEITDINMRYLQQKRLNMELLGRGFAWFDTGTPRSLLEAGEFIAAIEDRQSLKIGCIEEIAFRKGFITASDLMTLAKDYCGNGYSEYLINIAGEADAL